MIPGPGGPDRAAPDPAALATEVAARDWYHTLELAPGVVTPGWFDLRPVLDRVPLPPDLAGLRCLDVGTFDGFWAFEMERRGAAEVLAVDVLDPRGWDWPAGSDAAVVATIGARKVRAGVAGSGFDVAKAALGSAVQRLELSVHDLDPAAVGTFDLVYVGSLLLHLRDPVGALMAVRRVVRDGGLLVSVDAVSAALSVLAPRRPLAALDGVGRPWWWKPNVAALARMVAAAGFAVEGAPVRLWLPPGAGQPLPPRSRRALPGQLLTRGGRAGALAAWRGDPHAAVVGHPR